MLDRVTITGADDSIEPAYLLELSTEFSFVEWGILISETRTGTPRFPSAEWRGRLQSLCMKTRTVLSAHLCGFWVRQLLLGVNVMLPSTLDRYNRIQLNFHAERNQCKPEKAMKALNAITCRSLFGEGLQFIFQLDGAGGNEHLEDIGLEYVNAYGEPCPMVGLFDVSGGAGVLPDKWPAPIYHNEGVFDYHGYAGGLGPDNLADQLPRIHVASEGIRHWIDMETKVRSADDRQFDLGKVRECLQIAAAYLADCGKAVNP